MFRGIHLILGRHRRPNQSRCRRYADAAATRAALPPPRRTAKTATKKSASTGRRLSRMMHSPASLPDYLTPRRWAHVVARRANVISRSLPHLGRFFPDLAVGVFHQENDRPTARGQDAASSAQPCFVGTVSGARFLVGEHHLLADDGGLLDHSCPVASRNGRLVLELRHEGRATNGLRLAVCNPMIRDSIVVLPPMISASAPGKKTTIIRDYGCALLTGHDLHPPRCSNFFRLLLVYNHSSGRAYSTVLRIYSSDTGCWGPEVECSVKIPSSKIRHMGAAVVCRGVAFWALDQGVLGVRLDQTDDAGATDVHQLVPYNAPHYWPNNWLLGVSPDNRLFFIYVGVTADPSETMLCFRSAEDEDINTFQEWAVQDQETEPMEETKMTHHHTGVRLRWFGEKSGIVLFTMAERSGDTGTFLHNLREKVVEKVADDGDSWKNLLGYEIDMAGYLASLARCRP